MYWHLYAYVYMYVYESWAYECRLHVCICNCRCIMIIMVCMYICDSFTADAWYIAVSILYTHNHVYVYAHDYVQMHVYAAADKSCIERSIIIMANFRKNIPNILPIIDKVVIILI